jgi:2-amino-4-hydroxy-6-hydroxymethyldihydropteridine diphosphokinase
MKRWHNVFIGIGSNLGSAKKNCQRGINALKKKKEIDFVQCSLFYETEPIGGPEQPPFINCVAEIKTTFLPKDLLEYLKELETKMGRVKTIHWGPRVIDFDILFFGNLIIDTINLKIPHPLCHKRRFVLEPMGEIAPNLIHPVLKKSIRELKNLISSSKEEVKIYKE